MGTDYPGFYQQGVETMSLQGFHALSQRRSGGYGHVR